MDIPRVIEVVVGFFFANKIMCHYSKRRLNETPGRQLNDDNLKIQQPQKLIKILPKSCQKNAHRNVLS